MKHLKAILFQNRKIIVILLATGALASVMEGLGLGLVIPLLEGVKGTAGLDIPFPFSAISAFFSGMDLVERIRVIALFLVVVALLKGSALYFNNIFNCRLQIEVIKYYRMKGFDQIMKFGMGYMNKQKTSHLQTTLITHTERLGSLISIVGALLPQMFTVIVLMAMLAVLSWKLTLVSLAIVVFSSALLRAIAHRAEAAGKKLSFSLKEINRAALDALLGMKVIRLFRRERDMIKRLETEVNTVNSNMFALAKTRGSVKPLFEILGVVSLALILLVGSFLILPARTGWGLEIVLTFILVFFRVLPPALAFNQARVAIKGDLAYYREVNKFIEPQPEFYLENGRRMLKDFGESIVFRGVEFGYNPREAIVLKELFFEVPKGSRIGIVGPSGCGKSTIVELLLRFYDPQKGKILIDGFDLKDLDINSWRRRVGVVSQDTFLFHDSVRENIAFARPEASQEEIEQAAKQAYAHEFIQALPKGYDTLVGDRGVLLSGGQRQRLAIARAIVMNPDILVFDEATSSLDTESEQIVQKALDEVGVGKTVITIAHRLSTVYDSDKILVVDKGMIVQQGKHEELIKQETGLYQRLVQKQKMDFKDSGVLL
ncbi:MAG: ABC transporter ATP-binding protein [Candidatus Omnitrophota bacterium]